MRFNKKETRSRGRNNKSAVRYLEFGPASNIKQGDGLQSDVILPIRGQDVAHNLVNASINIELLYLFVRPQVFITFLSLVS